MSAAIYNFFIEQASDFQITFEYLDSESNPIDISNYCIRFRMKDDLNVVRIFSSDIVCSNYSLLKNNNGIILFRISSNLTKTFNFDSAVYDLDIASSDNIENFRIATGRIEIIKNNFPECSDSISSICRDCNEITCSDSTGFSIEPEPDTPSVTPTVSQTAVPPDSPCSMTQEDLCGYLCQDIDMFGKLYSGSGFPILDNSISSGVIEVSNTGIITNVEVSIDKFAHNYPQDVSCLLFPPSGDPILLFSHNKINNYNSINGLTFAFSNRALPDKYLNNRSNTDFYLNIMDKTNLYNFSFDGINNISTISNLNSVVGHNVTGEWSIVFSDDDLLGSGSIEGWNLILTYEPPPYSE